MASKLFIYFNVAYKNNIIVEWQNSFAVNANKHNKAK